MKSQPPPPDKEWEELYTTVAIFLDNLNIRDDFPIIVTHKTYKVNDLDSLMKIFLDWLKKHDKALFLSKDQEADRRVREAVEKERERWINQPYNKHDEEIRKEAIIKGGKMFGRWAINSGLFKKGKVKKDLELLIKHFNKDALKYKKNFVKKLSLSKEGKGKEVK